MITLLLILLLALVVVGGGGPSSSWQGLNGIRTQLQQPQLSCPRMPASARIETTTTCSAAHPPVKINWGFTCKFFSAAPVKINWVFMINLKMIT
jgi:hypothetical protein